MDQPRDRRRILIAFTALLVVLTVIGHAWERLDQWSYALARRRPSLPAVGVRGDRSGRDRGIELEPADEHHVDEVGPVVRLDDDRRPSAGEGDPFRMPDGDPSAVREDNRKWAERSGVDGLFQIPCANTFEVRIV